ncbi:MAG: ABC transporter ATP-binding protein [Chloroflexi bacterium]|nr:ABC transporter ATP-binding protein [Chloroflexota bacterium]
MASVILADNEDRRFGDVRALDGVSFEVTHGEVVGLLGHSGAGKTTTIRLLNGLLRPDGGTIRVLDLDPTVAGAEVRARTGVLTETPSLDERLTARENLVFYAELYGVTAARVQSRVGDCSSSSSWRSGRFAASGCLSVRRPRYHAGQPERERLEGRRAGRGVPCAAPISRSFSSRSSHSPPAVGPPRVRRRP